MSNMLTNFHTWSNLIKGVYRHTVATSVCYEIMILHHEHDTDILTAKASLYISGEWNEGNGWYYERKLLHTGTVKECLDAALKDYNDNEDLK